MKPDGFRRTFYEDGAVLKILLHGLNFSPEEIGIGKYSGEMVDDWLRRGAEVTVVTTPPYYPQWQIRQGYRGFWYTAESNRSDTGSIGGTTFNGATSNGATCDGRNFDDMAGSLSIIRCPLWVPRRLSGLKRIIHLASFGLSSVPVVLWIAIRRRPDVVMTVEPSAFCMPTSWLAARLCGAQAWLHVQDFEVDAAFELGILKQPWLKRTALAMEAFWMRRFDRVSSISTNMVKKLEQKGVAPARTYLLANWVDCDAIRPLDRVPPDSDEQRAFASTGSDELNDLLDLAEHSAPFARSPNLVADRSQRSRAGLVPPTSRQIRHAIRERFGLPTDRCIALYAGNIGAKQGLDLILEAAKLQIRNDSRPQHELASDHCRLHFVICGHGAAHADLVQAAEGVSNIQFLPIQPSERFNELMNAADIHLLPQRADAADLVMPSKLTGMLATGRPVVACAAEGTQIASVVSNFGSVVDPGDALAFHREISLLAEDEELRQRLGGLAREYALNYLSQESILGMLWEQIEAVSRRR